MQQKPLVFTEIANLMGIESASEDTPKWFSKRMVAIGNVIASMTPDEREALDKEVQRMAKAGFPLEERMQWVMSLCWWPKSLLTYCARRAKRFCSRRLDAAAHSQFLEMGLLSITFVTREEYTGGKPRLAVEVYVPTIHCKCWPMGASHDLAGMIT